MAYFKYFLLLKTVYLKAEAIVPAVANFLCLVVVIVAFRNLSLVVVDLKPLLVLRQHSTQDQSKFGLLASLSLKVSDLLPSEASNSCSKQSPALRIFSECIIYTDFKSAFQHVDQLTSSHKFGQYLHYKFVMLWYACNSTTLQSKQGTRTANCWYSTKVYKI